MADLADPGSHYTRRVIDIAVRLVVEDGLPYRTAGWTLFAPITACSSLMQRSRTGLTQGAQRIDTEHLDWALSDFSGYIAADELYDGPFCILSIVDNRTFKRISSTGSWTTTRPTPTSRRSSATSTRLSRRGG